MAGIYLKEYQELIENLKAIPLSQVPDNDKTIYKSHVDLAFTVENLTNHNLLQLTLSGKLLGAEDITKNNIDILPSENHEKKINYLKQIQTIILNIFDKLRLEHLTESILNEGLILLRNFYPKIYKALYSFKRIKDSNCPTLSVADQKGIVVVRYNPTSPAIIALEESAIALMNSYITKGNFDIDISVFRLYLNLYGAFEWFHEFYHVFSRHIYELQSVENLELENIIADQYVNSRLMVVFNSNPVVKKLVRSLSIGSMSINTGISDTVNLTSYISKTVVNLSKAKVEQWNKIISPMIVSGNNSISNFNLLQDFLNQSALTDKIMISAQHYKAMQQDYESFSTYTKQLIKLFTANVDDIELIDPVQQRFQGRQSKDSSSAEGFTTRSKSIDSKSSDNSDGQDNNKDQGTGSQDSTQSNNSSSDESSKSANASSTSSQQGGSQNNLPKYIPSIDNKDILEELDKILEEASKDNDNPVNVPGKENDTVALPSNERSITAFIEDNTPSNVLISNDWRVAINRFIEDATSDDIENDSDMPNRRIEGQRGGLKTVSKIGLLALLFDASISMNVEKYKAALTYVLDLTKQGDIYDEICFVYWGSTYEVVRPFSSYGKVVYDRVRSKWTKQGGTVFDNAIKPFVYEGLVGYDPDMMIVFTDAQLAKEYDKNTYIIDPRCKSWFMSRKNKILYVLTPDGKPFKKNILEMDPSAKRRIIVMPTK